MPLPAWVPIASEVGGSILSALGGASAANKQRQAARDAQRSQERMSYQGMGQSDRQFGYNANAQRSSNLDQRALEAARVQGQLNRAPMADQAQYLLMQRLGAAPRDITRGTAAFQSAPNPQMAASSYRPGMGGVDTSALQSAFDRLRDPSQVPGEYTPMSSSANRLDGQRAALASAMATERDPRKRDLYARQIAEIDRMMAGESAGTPISESYDREAGIPREMLESDNPMVRRLLRAQGVGSDAGQSMGPENIIRRRLGLPMGGV